MLPFILLAACTPVLLPPASAHVPAGTGASAVIAGLRWLEPSLLLIAAVLYAAGLAVLWRRAGFGRGVGIGRVAAFGAGLLLLAIALLGPPEEYAQVSLAAHMVQHMLLLAAVPPLLLAGRPGIVCGRLLQGVAGASHLLPDIGSGLRSSLRVLRTSPRLVPVRSPLGAAALQALVLWGWHLPAAVALALADDLVHVVMHASFLAAGLLFWWTLLASLRTPLRMSGAGFGGGAVALLVTMVHMGLLSALLTFAPRPWYAAYAAQGSLPGGLSPLEDQQLAGVLMWVPSAVPYIVGVLLFTALWLRALERRSAAGQRVV